MDTARGGPGHLATSWQLRDRPSEASDAPTSYTIDE